MLLITILKLQIIRRTNTKNNKQRKNRLDLGAVCHILSEVMAVDKLGISLEQKGLDTLVQNEEGLKPAPRSVCMPRRYPCTLTYYIAFPLMVASVISTFGGIVYSVYKSNIGPSQEQNIPSQNQPPKEPTPK